MSSDLSVLKSGGGKIYELFPQGQTLTGAPLSSPGRGRGNQPKHLLGSASGENYIDSEGDSYIPLSLPGESPVSAHILLFGSKVSSLFNKCSVLDRHNFQIPADLGKEKASEWGALSRSGLLVLQRRE